MPISIYLQQKNVIILQKLHGNSINTLKIRIMKKIFVLMAFMAFGCGAQAAEIETRCYVQDDVVVDKPDVLPEFPGGMQALMSYIGNNVKYPDEASKKKVEGKVIVEFVVKKDGSVADAKVISKTNEMLNKEALRVINAMPKWKPGKNKGKVVDVRFVLPVAFKLQ